MIPAVLLVAVAAGALTMAIVAILRPALPTRIPSVLVWVASAAGAIAVGIADTAPTGWEPFDLVLRVGFGALIPLAAARAGTVSTSWLLLVSVAALLIVDAPGAPVAAVAAGAFWALAAAGLTTPTAAALAAAAGIGPLAHLDWPVATGASAAAVAVAALPVLLTGLARTGRPARGRIALAITLAVVVLGFSAAAGLVAALSARTDIDRAVDFARDGIDQLGDDDDRARSSLRDAAGAFASAEEDLTVWWARSALLVPGVAQQSRAVTTMASAGADLARTAADATEDADVDSVRPRGGRIDLEALGALQEPLDRSLSSLRQADRRLDDIDSPLLVSPLADRLETLRTEVTGALGSAELASQAVAIAPDMLGADGPRRYLIAFQNTAELTGNGGFFGNWAEIVTEDGQLTLARSGRNRELTDGGPDPEGRAIEGEEEFVTNYPFDPARYWGNINLTPDHPTVGRVMAQLYPQSGGTEVDGVFAITPTAMAALLELTGPITVPGYEGQLTSENAERILLHEQYLQFPDQSDDDREEFLSEAVDVLFDVLTSGELPGPRAIAEELGPAVDSRHLKLWAARADEQALFERMGATGEASRGSVDSFGVVTQNFNGSKIDWFLRREVAYEVNWDPESGEVKGTITANIRNEAPSSGLPASVIGWGGDESLGQRPVADGENFMLVTMYASVPIEQITVDGEPMAFTSGRELGHHTGRLHLSVTSQSVRTIVAHTRGVVADANRYTTQLLRQPTIHPDEVQIVVQVATGWQIDTVRGGDVNDRSSTALTRGNASEQVAMSVDVSPEPGRLSLLDRLRGIGAIPPDRG